MSKSISITNLSLVTLMPEESTLKWTEDRRQGCKNGCMEGSMKGRRQKGEADSQEGCKEGCMLESDADRGLHYRPT